MKFSSVSTLLSNVFSFFVFSSSHSHVVPTIACNYQKWLLFRAIEVESEQRRGENWHFAPQHPEFRTICFFRCCIYVDGCWIWSRTKPHSLVSMKSTQPMRKFQWKKKTDCNVDCKILHAKFSRYIMCKYFKIVLFVHKKCKIVHKCFWAMIVLFYAVLSLLATLIFIFLHACGNHPCPYRNPIHCLNIHFTSELIQAVLKRNYSLVEILYFLLEKVHDQLSFSSLKLLYIVLYI